jgi:hypothetical protein
MLSGGASQQAELLGVLGDWPEPLELKGLLPGDWFGTYFLDGLEAVAAASRGPMGAVLMAPHAKPHMVVLEPQDEGFLVRDPWPGVTYNVDEAWISTFVAAGVFR